MKVQNKRPISKRTSDLGYQVLFADIQGNILKSHARKHVRLLFLRFGNDQKAIVHWIKQRILPQITSMEEQLNQARIYAENQNKENLIFMSFSLSASGYKALGLSASALPADLSFRNGMRSGSIAKDPPVANWEEPYQEKIDAVIVLAGNRKSELLEQVGAIKTLIPTFAADVVHEEVGASLGTTPETEHFGFADGISQPRFFTEDMPKPESRSNWDPFASLSLVLTKDFLGTSFVGGTEEGIDIPVENGHGNYGYGSYLVFRKLEQNVRGWDNAIKVLSSQLNISSDLAGAYAVGRFKDGTPVINQGKASGSSQVENNFDFTSDMKGTRCPFHAHIRKANPRGDTSRQFQASFEVERSRRIARRGIPYTEPENKGLLFMCYQSKIVEQFDFIQNHWIDAEDFLLPGTGADSLLGQGNTTKRRWPSTYGVGQPQHLSFNHFVTMQGGEYFFTPSISSLKALENNIQFN